MTERTLAHIIIADPLEHPQMRFLRTRLYALRAREALLHPLGDSTIDVEDGRIIVERTPPQPVRYRTYIVERDKLTGATAPAFLPDALLAELVDLGASNRTIEKLRRDIAAAQKQR
jgi:hypothetical protein